MKRGQFIHVMQKNGGKKLHILRDKWDIYGNKSLVAVIPNQTERMEYNRRQRSTKRSFFNKIFSLGN